MTGLPVAELPILYSFRRCPYAMRARLALQVSGQGYRLREVRLSDRPPQLYEISPKGTVPVLQLPDGTVLDESLEIMRWTLGRHDPKGWLPTGDEEAMQTEALLRGLDEEFKPNLDRYKYTTRYPGAVSEDHRELASRYLRTLEQRFATSPFLFGAHPRLADMALAPFVRQFAMTDRTWFDGEPWPGLKRWLEAFLASPLFAAVMPKREFWVPGGEDLVVAPRV